MDCIYVNPEVINSEAVLHHYVNSAGTGNFKLRPSISRRERNLNGRRPTHVLGVLYSTDAYLPTSYHATQISSFDVTNLLLTT